MFEQGSHTEVTNKMRFVVGSSAGADKDNPNFDLRHELNLLKAALLYADKVELVSAGASLLYGFVTLSQVQPEERLALVRKHAPNNAGYRLTEDQLKKMDLVMNAGSRELRRVLGKRKLVEVRKQLQAVADKVWQEMKSDVEKRFEAYNATGLPDAVESGLLEMHTFGGHTLDGMISMAAEGFTVEAAVEDILQEYLKKASIAVEGHGYPLFDDLIGSLVGEAVRDGLIAPSPAAIHRGRHGGLSGDLLSRLPLFEEATVEEILDIRNDLETPLRNFRLAVSGFSREIQSAAWEPGFAEEVEILFREKVEAEIAGIEEAVKENRSYEQFSKNMIRHGVSGAMIGAAVGSISDLSLLTSVVMGGGAAAVRALLDQHEKNRDIEKNQLFFYYGSRELLRNLR